MLVLPGLALAAPMTNDDVIKMVKGGLGEATVIQAINTSEPNFDTSTDGLVKLKQGGVNDRIIQQIIAQAPRRRARGEGAGLPGMRHGHRHPRDRAAEEGRRRHGDGRA